MHKGDEVKVVVTELSGDGKFQVYFGNLEHPHLFKASFILPGEYTFILPEDGWYRLCMVCNPYENVFYQGDVYYKGYVDVYSREAYAEPI